MPRLLPLAFIVPLVVALGGGCRQNDDPEGAKQLFGKINDGQGFRSWRRAPGFPFRKPSFTAHSNEVELFINEPIAKALQGPEPAAQWPVGSIIVKEGFSDRDTRSLIAVMERRADGWYWAEFDGDGEPLYSGQPKICIDCHENRKEHSDWVYAFELPR